MDVTGTLVTVFTFGTPVAFWYTKDRISVVLGIIPSEFWYIYGTFIHFTVYKL